MLIRTGFGGQLSGSVGGVVASHNKGGQYLRNRSLPTNPNSAAQTRARDAFAAAAIAWRSLTVAVREGWEAYAAGTPVVNRLGESITVSGFNMFVRTAAFFTGAGFPSAIPAAAPISPGLADLGSNLQVALATGTGAVMFGVTATLTGPGIIQIGYPVSPGISFYGGPYTAFRIAEETNEFLTLAAGTEAVNRYGVPVAGERRPVRVRGSDGAGRLTEEFTTIVTVA
jgi:hypothetical protein